MDQETLKELIATISTYVTKYGMRLIGAIILLIIGFWVIKIVVKTVSKGIDKKVEDASLKGFD